MRPNTCIPYSAPLWGTDRKEKRIMKYVYPTIFTPDEGGYRVRVPDLPGLVSFGDSLADALSMARDAIEMWLWDAENNGERIPEPTPIDHVNTSADGPGAVVNYVFADTDEYRRQNDTRAVKKTLSIPAWLDHQAQKANAPFSQILQQGIKDYLGLPRQ